MTRLERHWEDGAPNADDWRAAKRIAQKAAAMTTQPQPNAAMRAAHLINSRATRAWVEHNAPILTDAEVAAIIRREMQAEREELVRAIEEVSQWINHVSDGQIFSTDLLGMIVPICFDNARAALAEWKRGNVNAEKTR